MSSAYVSTEATVATGVHSAAGATAADTVAAPRIPHAITARPTPSASSGTAPRSTDVTPYTVTHSGALGGR